VPPLGTTSESCRPALAALSICYLGKQMPVRKAVPGSQQLDIGKVAFCRRCAGAGEPFTTAAGVLGLMAVWRCFYAVQLGKELVHFRPATFQACACQCLPLVSMRVPGRPVASPGTLVDLCTQLASSTFCGQTCGTSGRQAVHASTGKGTVRSSAGGSAHLGARFSRSSCTSETSQG